MQISTLKEHPVKAGVEQDDNAVDGWHNWIWLDLAGLDGGAGMRQK